MPPKKKPMTGKPEVHKDLDGFEININEFGEIQSNLPMDKLNEFLDENVDDKKLDDEQVSSRRPPPPRPGRPKGRGRGPAVPPPPEE